VRERTSFTPSSWPREGSRPVADRLSNGLPNKKRGEPEGSPRRLARSCFLEAELYTQCYLARVAAPGGSGLVEGRLVGYQIVPLRGRGDRRGLIHAAGGELWMIEQVEKSCGEIQPAPFCNVEVLGDAEVPVVDTGGREVSLTGRG